MANIITMAGKGKRFSEEGYILPKPLIGIDGEPMIWKVIDNLPKAKKWIFVVRQEHIDRFEIDKIIKHKIKDAIVVVDKDLLGGASIFCAEKYLDQDEEILIAGCDNGYLFDEKKYRELKKNKTNECILWTFTKDKRLIESPNSWGYALLENDGKTIKDMSVKIPISSNSFNDHAVTATFYLQSSRLLFESIRLMIKEEIKTNGEYYLDNLPIVLKMMNKKSVIFDIELYIGWGTPKELHTYEEITFYEKYMNLNKLNMSVEEKILWKRYFDRKEEKKDKVKI